jgi:hypothetical protein
MSSPPGGADLTYLWGIVNRAVRDPELRSRAGGVVQNIWESYKQTYTSAGLTAPTLGIMQVNALVATAAAQARAEIELGRSIATYKTTGLDQAIMAAHIAPDIDLRPGAGTIHAPHYRVRIEARVGVEGETMSRYLTWSPELDLPASVGSLLTAAEEAAMGAAEDYGEDFVGLGDLISITAV